MEDLMSIFEKFTQTIASTMAAAATNQAPAVSEPESVQPTHKPCLQLLWQRNALYRFVSMGREVYDTGEDLKELQRKSHPSRRNVCT
ncbi:hypothetical protein AX14_006050, partial [Amanita brunnescens Koide BX004]